LRWDTKAGNIEDMKIHGTYGRGGILPGKLNGMYGKKHTLEARAKMQGRKFSAEHRANLRAARKRFLARSK
jgi:hypothetical protein